MTCKDCILEPKRILCISYFMGDDEITGEELTDIEKRCKSFKNKADFVEVEKYNELRENFVDFACSGVNNLAPYCENRCVECVDEQGWCRYGSSCKGFNPDGKRE